MIRFCRQRGCQKRIVLLGNEEDSFTYQCLVCGKSRVQAHPDSKIYKIAKWILILALTLPIFGFAVYHLKNADFFTQALTTEKQTIIHTSNSTEKTPRQTTAFADELKKINQNQWFEEDVIITNLKQVSDRKPSP